MEEKNKFQIISMQEALEKKNNSVSSGFINLIEEFSQLLKNKKVKNFIISFEGSDGSFNTWVSNQSMTLVERLGYIEMSKILLSGDFEYED